MKKPTKIWLRKREELDPLPSSLKLLQWRFLEKFDLIFGAEMMGKWGLKGPKSVHQWSLEFPKDPHTLCTLSKLEIWLKNLTTKSRTCLCSAEQDPYFSYQLFEARNLVLLARSEVVIQILPLHSALESILTHVRVLLGGPSGGHRGFLLRSFDTRYILLCIGTIETQFLSQTIHHNISTKHYDTLVPFRLVFGRLRRLTSKDSQTLRIDF